MNFLLISEIAAELKVRVSSWAVIQAWVVSSSSDADADADAN